MSDFYDFGKVLSYNATMNMIMGARGVGKTYGAKTIVMNNYAKRGEEFIYLRRYRSELKSVSNFFADIAHEFPEYEWRVVGHEAHCRPTGEEKWKTCGYFIPLSTSQANKSTAYPKVTNIIFDEFIIEKGSIHYLPDEVKRLYDFYSTVDRWQDRTRVIMLSNAISITNPYFIEYDIEPTKEIVRRGNGFIVAHFVDSAAFAERIRRTKFGSFISKYAGEYADYSISNDFADAHDEYLTRKWPEAKIYCTLRTRKGAFSIWKHGFQWYCQRKLPAKSPLRLAYDVQHREGEALALRSDPLMSMLRTAYRQGVMYFDAAPTRNIFREIFK